MSKIITASIIGTGARGRLAYGSRLLKFPEQIKVVAVADIDPIKLNLCGDEHGIPSEMRFNSAEELLKQPKLSDLLFICNQDRDHFHSAIPALERGYDIILEKPISPSLEECKKIAEKAAECGRKVLVCHVLRYTPFYSKLKELIDSKVIGDIVTVNAEEAVGYWHQAHSFVRGNWRNSNETSPMILAKCCHDMDILLWLLGKKCLKVSSFGSLRHFKPENAPEGSADRCCNCPEEVKAKCPYEVKKFYIDGPIGLKNGYYGWPRKVVMGKDPTIENVTEALKTGPYGRCVYKCDNDVVDNQIVNMLLEDNVTVNFTMSAFSADTDRSIRIRGTHGEIIGKWASDEIKLTVFGEEPIIFNPHNSSKKDGAGDTGGHGGGDIGLIKSIINLFGKGETSPSVTYIDKSIESHFVALAAENSRVNGGSVVDMKEWTERF